MLWEEFVHVMRASYNVTGEDHFVIVGSQSILGNKQWHEGLPCDITGSNELDIVLIDAPDDFDLINGAIGECSQFHATHSYYADGIDLNTIRLPNTYLDRVLSYDVDIEDEQHTIVQVDFLSVEDAIAAKLYAGRQKDLSYIAAVKQHFDVDASQLMDSIGELEPDFEQFTCLLALYDAL